MKQNPTKTTTESVEKKIKRGIRKGTLLYQFDK